MKLIFFNAADALGDHFFCLLLKKHPICAILIYDSLTKGENTVQFIKRNIPSALFGSFMLFQLMLLGLGNHAGEGWLSDSRREQVYYGLQVLVIIGFIAYAAAERYLKGNARKYAGIAVLSVLAAGSLIMSLADKGSLFYVSVTFAVMPFLGFLGGAVYRRMSIETAGGKKTALRMGVGCAAAVAIQYVIQLQWGETPLLPVFMPAALLLVLLALRREPDAPPQEAAEPTAPRSLLFACLTAAAFILFTSFYNGYIHHLQIQTGYTEYNVYSWPRLMLIPCYLLIALIGDKCKGRFVPVVSLCISLAAVMNSVLSGKAGAYWLNMCLYYCAIAAAVVYYDLIFWRLAEGTKHPALWASAGRILDSVMVLLCAGLNISKLDTTVVLAVNIACLAALILLMAVSGAFNLSDVSKQQIAPELLSPESTLDLIKERFSLTPREKDVLRELVLTEDKQTAISDRLSISVKVLQKHVTSIYKKTGAETRSGLAELYRKTMIGQ